MRIVLPLLVLAAAACGPKYTSAALGQYDEFQPFIHFGGSDLQIEVARQAYVSIIAVHPPAGGFEDGPLLFSARYPLWESDRLHFTPGYHRLISRRTNMIDPLGCRTEQKPSLAGCRRRVELLPGMRGVTVPRAPSHYIMIAAEAFVDPFELADELYFQARENRELDAALRGTNATLAAPYVERVMLDRRGTPLWAAIYVATR